MANVAEHIKAADAVICANIATLRSQRDLLSQNILGQLRNLVEGVAVRLQTGRGDVEYNYDAIEAALSWVKANGRLNFVTRFHTLLKPSVSHYTFDGDTSERLMLRYYEYMLRLRTLLYDEASVVILSNLELFPLDQDPALAEYHEKIAVEIDKLGRATSARHDRFYIHKTRPFVTGGRVFYEVTFYKAVNRVSKADRIIGFTDIDIADNYSANLGLQAASIEVFGQQMPVTLIRNWEVSIRPCEVDHFASLVGKPTKVRTDSAEYKFVMAGLTGGSTLLDLIDASDEWYNDVKARGTATSRSPQIFPAIDEAQHHPREEARPQSPALPASSDAQRLAEGAVPLGTEHPPVEPQCQLLVHSVRRHAVLHRTAGPQPAVLGPHQQPRCCRPHPRTVGSPRTAQCRGSRDLVHADRRTRGPRRRSSPHRHLQQQAVLQAPARS